jgi:N-acetylmuramoyl-L-alanine amidase-like protein
LSSPFPTRRELLRLAGAVAAALALPPPRLLRAYAARNPDRERLDAWTAALRADELIRREEPIGRAAARVGELAEGTPYEAGTLDTYLSRGGSRPPSPEPLALSLTRFDCATLVESCLAVPRAAARDTEPSWDRFGHEIERMRYRGGVRHGYASRLHYFSEWITDGERRGLVRDLGAELGGAEDARPLRFMTAHRAKYPALGDGDVFREVGAMERRLDGHPRRVVPTKRIPEVVGRIETGDVLAFATEIPGLDVTHAAFAYRDSAGVLRVLHAPLSGGVVEVTRTTLPEYVAAIPRATGILAARPLWATA